MALANSLFDDPARVVGFTIAVQHLALTLSIGYLASAYRKSWKILIVSAFASLGSALSLYSHGLFTEGLALPKVSRCRSSSSSWAQSCGYREKAARLQ